MQSRRRDIQRKDNLMLLQVLTLRSRAVSGAKQSTAPLQTVHSNPGQRRTAIACPVYGWRHLYPCKPEVQAQGRISAAKRSMSWKGHQVQFGAPIGTRLGPATRA